MRRPQDNKKDELRRDAPNVISYVKKEKQAGRPAAAKEKLTPEEVWRNAALLLGSKKKDAEQRPVERHKKYDFGEVQSRIAEVNRARMAELKMESEEAARQRFYEVETANSLLHIPNFREIENSFVPRKRIEVPDFFPKTPLYVFDSPDIFKKLDADTLFFIFYSQLGTVQQYYAAAQLKAYSWRFHTKYFTWFQRLDEPKLITADYERGDFLFFDYDVTWSFMKKNDFTFEYRYLECSEW
jgi:CCR4-NOT transcription complex subunit 3